MCRGTVAYANWLVAEELKRMGGAGRRQGAVVNTSIAPGVLGNIRSSDSMSGALARLQIVAGVYSREGSENFWKADEAARRRVIEPSPDPGRSSDVDDKVPEWAVAEGWRRLVNTIIMLFPCNIEGPYYRTYPIHRCLFKRSPLRRGLWPEPQRFLNPEKTERRKVVMLALRRVFFASRPSSLYASAPPR